MEKEKTKNKKLKIILPIVSSLIVLLIVLMVVLSNGVNQNNYFNSLKSNFTKQIQHTTITESNTIVYEKFETIIFDNNKVYHKIVEKRISSSHSVLYDEVTTEYYYFNNKMYYLENNTWKTVDFNIENSLKTYQLKADYFVEYTFDEKFKDTGTFSGLIKDEHVNDVFNSETNLKSADIKITVNEKFNVNTCNINAKTATNRDVKIENTFTYNKESVTLPIN